MTISSMFQQLNQAVQQSPINGPTGRLLVDQMSQAGGGLMSSAFGGNPYQYQTAGAKQKQLAQDLTGLDMSTTEGKVQAATLAGQAGNVQLADQLQERVNQERAQEVKSMLDARQQATREQRLRLDAQKAAAEAAEAEAKREETAAEKAAKAGRIKSAAAMAKKAEKPKLAKAVEDGIVSPKDAFEMMNPKPGSQAQRGSSTTGTVMDESGRYFAAARSFDENGDLRLQYKALDEGPDDTVGAVVPVSSATAANAFMSPEIEAEKEWLKLRGEMVMAVPEFMETRYRVKQGLELLDTTATGGIARSIANAKDFLGLGDTADVRMLNNKMSEFVLAEIKKLGVNPTDRDLQFLWEAVPNLGNGTEANVALFEDTLNRLNRVIRAREFLVKNPEATREEYVANYDKIMEEEEKASNPQGELSPAAKLLQKEDRDFIRR